MKRLEFGELAREMKLEGENVGQARTVSALDKYYGMSILPWRKALPDKKQKYQLIVGRVFDILRSLGRAPFYRNKDGICIPFIVS